MFRGVSINLCVLMGQLGTAGDFELYAIAMLLLQSLADCQDHFSSAPSRGCGFFFRHAAPASPHNTPPEGLDLALVLLAHVLLELSRLLRGRLDQELQAAGPAAT